MMKEELTNQIDATFNNLINTYTSIAEPKVNVIPFDSSWTAAQLIQHLILSCSGFEKLLSGSESEADRPFDQNVANIKLMFESPEKMQSPKEIDPHLKPYDQQRQLNKLHELSVAIPSAVAKCNLAALATSFKFAEGYLTKYEAAYFLVYHTQRHIKQLENIAKYLMTA